MNTNLCTPWPSADWSEAVVTLHTSSTVHTEIVAVCCISNQISVVSLTSRESLFDIDQDVTHHHQAMLICGDQDQVTDAVVDQSIHVIVIESDAISVHEAVFVWSVKLKLSGSVSVDTWQLAQSQLHPLIHPQLAWSRHAQQAELLQATVSQLLQSQLQISICSQLVWLLHDQQSEALHIEARQISSHIHPHVPYESTWPILHVFDINKFNSVWLILSHVVLIAADDAAVHVEVDQVELDIVAFVSLLSPHSISPLSAMLLIQ